MGGKWILTHAVSSCLAGIYRAPDAPLHQHFHGPGVCACVCVCVRLRVCSCLYVCVQCYRPGLCVYACVPVCMRVYTALNGALASSACAHASACVCRSGRKLVCPCVQFMVVRQCVCNVYVSCMYDARTHTLTHTQVSKFQGKVVPESKPLQIDPEVFDSGRTRSLVTEHILSLLRASRCRLTPQWSRLRSPCVLE